MTLKLLTHLAFLALANAAIFLFTDLDSDFIMTRKAIDKFVLPPFFLASVVYVGDALYRYLGANHKSRELKN